jgi:hypothetical protein
MTTLFIVICTAIAIAVIVGFVLYKLMEDDDGN